MSWLYTPIYITLLAICFTQSFYPIFMFAAMILRQSRLLYAFFHSVDATSKRHGGELAAQVFKDHGVQNIFTLPGGHVSPIVVASDKLSMKVIDVRHEATAVFAADASARLTGIPGVAVVTAGPGLTNTVTAIKNAQLAESPVVIVAGAAATMLKNRGSLQDIDQMSLLKSTTKKCFTVDCVRDITPTLREAFRVAQLDVPGPVFVELPVDILYPYQIIAEQFSSMSSSSSSAAEPSSTNSNASEPSSSRAVSQRKPSVIARIVAFYSEYCLKHIFADAWKKQDSDPLPVSLKLPKQQQVDQVADLLRRAKRPLAIVGSQAILRPHGPESVAENLRRLNIPVYLNGAARGLLGSNYPLQFRHARKQAIQGADCVLLLGAVCDFRLSYGRTFRRGTQVISVNRSLKLAKLNAGIFWNPALAIESDIGRFVSSLAERLLGKSCSSPSPSPSSSPSTSAESAAGPYQEKRAEPVLEVDRQWLESLRRADEKRDSDIVAMSKQPVDKYLNPLQVLGRLQTSFAGEDTLIVADGGDFVASAAYIMKPNGPMRWLDPGPFGTLGCGAGFALAAKLLFPERRVLAIMGDGAFGYALAELDTFVRHKLPVCWVIGNDACWTQIAREQVPMLGSSVGCQLAHTNYHLVAEGFGAAGHLLSREGDLDDIIQRAKAQVTGGQGSAEPRTVVVNALIGKTNFRDGSISV